MDDEPQHLVDAFGRVVASKGLVPPEPWVISESERFPGRYYFVNSQTRRTAWSLDASLLKPETRIGRTVGNAPRQPMLPRLVPGQQVGGTLGSSFRSLFRGLLPMRSNSAQAAEEEGEPTLRVVGGLARGGYGVVVEVENTVSGKRSAMKVVSKNKLRRHRDCERLELELKIMHEMKPSRFVQRCHDAFESLNSVFLVLDLQSGGDLLYHLMGRMRSTGQTFHEEEVRVILAELTLALEHVHTEGFVHRDVKIENVMLDAEGHVKLIDFGLAFEMTDEEMPMSPTGSLIYMAPELIGHKTGGRHTDWWAVGVLAFELLTGSCPWSSLQKSAIRQEIQHSVVSIPSNASPRMHEFIASLLEKDPRKRLGSRSDADIKAAPFFDSIDWEVTALGGNPPAFVPGMRCVSSAEAAGAFRHYQDLLRESIRESPEDKATASLWNSGLRIISSFPPVVPHLTS